MPIYFFNTVDGQRDRDTECLKLVNLNTAKKASVRYMAEAFHEDTDLIWDGRNFRVDMTNENNHSVLIVITMAIDAAAVWPDNQDIRRGPYSLTPPKPAGGVCQTNETFATKRR